MKASILAAVVAGVVGLGTAASAVTLTFDYDLGSNSTNNGDLNTSATADFTFTDIGGNVGVELVLTNTSPASTGGFITAFGFDTGATYANDFSTNSNLTNVLQNVDTNGPATGNVDLAFTLPPQGNGNQPSTSQFLGGGSPNPGIASNGGSGTFNFQLDTVKTAAEYEQFFASNYETGVFEAVVRFRGLANGGSDRLDVAPPDTTPVPLPAGGLLLLSALGGAAFLRRRKA